MRTKLGITGKHGWPMFIEFILILEGWAFFLTSNPYLSPLGTLKGVFSCLDAAYSSSIQQALSGLSPGIGISHAHTHTHTLTHSSANDCRGEKQQQEEIPPSFLPMSLCSACTGNKLKQEPPIAQSCLGFCHNGSNNS